MKKNEIRKYFWLLLLSIISVYFVDLCIVVVEMKIEFHLLFFSFAKVFLYSTQITMVLLVFFYLVYYLMIFHHEKTLDILYRYRYVFAIIVFIIGVIFEIHGSSIGEWETFLYGGVHKSIIGTVRMTRSDEWAVTTPMVLSQYYSNFGYFTDIIRGSLTDAFILCNLPVKDIVMIFRPFQIGYLFLSQGKGLSFYWLGRQIVLFLISFEFGMFLTQSKKRLSFIYACLIAFAPVVQWWFTAAGLVEMLISGQLMIILTNKYFSETLAFWKKIVISFLFFLCAFVFLFTLYPAWQIPFAYVYFVLFIVVIITNRKKIKIQKCDIIIWSIVSFGFICIAAHAFGNSYDTIKQVMNTAYPGSRFENGGENLSRFVSYPANLLFPFTQLNLIGNTCEHSQFFDLFPLGLILGCFVLFRQKKRDSILIALLVLCIVLSSRCIFVWPGFLSKISLLYMSQAKRTFVVVGFVNIMLLIKSMSLYQIKITKINISLICFISVVCSIVISLVCKNLFSNYISTSKIILIIVLLMGLFFSVLFWRKKFMQINLTILIIFISFVYGGLVNPIEHGLDYINDLSIIKEIKQENINNEVWLSEFPFPLNNMPLLAGARTINSTNSYPTVDRWKMFDMDGNDENIYNRYAHVYVTIQNDQETNFELMEVDAFHINLKVDDIKKLGANKIISNRDLEIYDTPLVHFEKTYDQDGYKIYNIVYQ